MANKTFATYLSELAEVSSLGAGDKVPVLESSTVKYVDGGDIGGGGSYLKYVALLSQSGTDAPVATVLENTLGGTVVWTRNDAGDYTGTLVGAFPVGKTFCASPSLSWTVGDISSGNLSREDDNTLRLFTVESDGSTTADVFTACAIEIRVYP